MLQNLKIDNGIYCLFDKYLKSNDNYLPLKAFLQFIESCDENLDGFNLITNVKSTNLIPLSDSNKSSNQTATLTLIKKHNLNEEQPVILAQKLYKIIITIDYSPQTSSLDFIKKGLEVIFKKISHEYDEFYDNCMNTEPQIYVTVLLWNSSPTAHFYNYSRDTNNQNKSIPFIIILHSKRLLKSNLNEIAGFIFNKINESKFIIIDSLKSLSEKELRVVTNEEEHSHTGRHNQKTKSSFEEFLRVIIKIFGYFCINEISNNNSGTNSAPTTLACSHHIHLTEGLIHATDMVRCLEKISKSSITFSFIYCGTNFNQTGSNISSSFGHLADYTIMRLISFISNGFYAYLNENLELNELIKNRLFYFYKLNPNLEQTKQNLTDSLNDSKQSSFESAQCDDESRDTFCQKSTTVKLTLKSHINRINRRTMSSSNNKDEKIDLSEIKSLFLADSVVDDQQFEFKFIQSYELNRKNLLQITRIRVQEGFYLSSINRKLVKFDSSQTKANKNSYCQITFYFKKYFTQTITLVYKLSYLVHISNHHKLVELNENESFPVELDDKQRSNEHKLHIELWISWNLLQLKAKYQNLELIKRVKQFLIHIQSFDMESTFELNSSMLEPPEILKIKEPLYKLSNDNLNLLDNHVIFSNDNNYFNNINNNMNLNQPKHIFSLQNLNFELNIRTNKNAEKDLFNEFAHAWKYLSFFKLNKNALNRYFGIHSIKLLLDYDKPLPDINSCLFDTKNRTILAHLEMISDSNLNYNSNLSPNYLKDLNKQNQNNNHYHQHHHHNPHHHHHIPNIGSSINNVFQCQNSLNKLRCMLNDWCDIVLVENLIYLKYLESSSKYLKAHKIKSPENKNKKMNINQSSSVNKENTNETDNDRSNISIESQPESKQNIEVNVSRNSSTNPTGSSISRVNSSFVIVITNEQYTPYVSLQYLFHSNVSYNDRICLLEKFKNRLFELNLKDVNQNSSQLSSTTSSISTSGSLTSFNQTTFSPGSKLTNISVEETQIQRPINTDLYNEYFHVLNKPDLYDAFKFIFFDELNYLQIESNNMMNLNNNNSTNTLNQNTKLNQSSKLINFMHQKKFKWLLNKNFSNQTAQNLKETIIDTFVRIRLKEGFKCLFQCSKFAVFTLQLSMFDSGEIIAENNLANDSSSSPVISNKNPNSNSNLTFKNGSTQICTFIYVIRFINNNIITSNLSKKVGLLNIATDFSISKSDENINQDDLKSSEVYFNTEIYVEAIDGIYQDRSKKIKDKQYWDYFRNLTNLEIINLIYLQDLKSFSILQSSFALFLSKSNKILNLSSLLKSKHDTQNVSNLNSSNLSFKDTLTNIANFNQGFYDCIRLLPDMSIILNKHSLKENKNSTSSKNRLTNNQYLFNRVNYNNRSTHNRPLVNSTNLTNSTEDLSPQIETQNTNKKKNLSLSEQLRPVLDCIDISRFFLNPVDFDFTLKGVLFESSLYICVYEDIPFNLFDNSNLSNKTINKQEIGCIKKLQTYFFNNVDNHFRKFDDNKDTSVIDSMKKDVKNALLLKLNDIKSGDPVIKKINEYLTQNEQTDQENFKVYIKFSISQVTSKQSMSSPTGQTSSSMHNKSDSSYATNNLIKTTNNFMQQQTQAQSSSQFDIENNKLFIYGLFFLNSNQDLEQTSNYSNRLVFFLFNCVSESIKTSLIQTQSNSFLIRKSLFASNKNTGSDSYRFYFSKNSSLSSKSNSNVDLKLINNNRNNSNTSNNSTSSNNNNNSKNFFQLSEILKLHLSLSNNNLNDSAFLNTIDSIEENCAKSYIRSLIHYLASFSLENTNESSEKESIHPTNTNFEKNSINRLLKLGSKIKLTDIDLTEYFRIICKHMNNFDDWNKCTNQNICHYYLEKKFDEIFLKRFNLLPGFNDLFIFTSTDNELATNATTNTNNKSDEFLREYQNDEDIDDEDYFKYEDEENHDNVEISIDESTHSYDSESLDENDTNYESDLNPTYYESDSNEQQTTTKSTFISISKSKTLNPRTRLGKKILYKSSSPYTSYHLISKISSKIESSTHQNSSAETSLSINEQIIGIELVCQVSTEYSSDINSDTLIDSQSRTRTTTLTPENNEFYPTINENLIQQQQTSQEAIANLNSAVNTTAHNQTNKLVLYSKFTKFNFTCLLNLMDCKDLDEFKSLIEKLDTNNEEKKISDDLKGKLSSIKVYLRFNWYSFNDLNTNNTNQIGLFALNSNQPPPMLQKAISHTGVIGSSNLSTHSSTSTVYNSGINHQFINKKLSVKFEYYHLLEPSLKEFKWHLKDEIFHSQQETNKLKNMKMFIFYMSHIRLGVLQKFKNCHLEKKKIVLNKSTVTTTISVIDPQPKTIAGKLSGSMMMNNTKKQTTTHLEEDKSILSVDSTKFFNEFTALLKNLELKFYNCNLQQMNENYYYMNCLLNDNDKKTEKLTFKILLSIRKETIKINPLKSNKASVSPSSLTQNENLSSPKTNSNLDSIKPKLLTQKQSVQSMNDLQKSVTNTVLQKQQQISKNAQVHQETTINQLKIRIYFSFNHSSFDQSISDQESLIKHIILEFNKELDNLIKLSYLKLTLKEIDDTRKWNNLLSLTDSTINENQNNIQTNLDASLTSNFENDLDDTFSSTLHLNVKTNDDSINTIKNQQGQTSLACDCVWSVLFKLHRLHQTLQKVHDVTPSGSIAEKPNTQSTSQLFISQGLNKLREYLHNFKIYESNCGDLYVYTRNKEIYLLKLEEIYEQQLQTNLQANNQTIFTQSNLTQISSGIADDNSVHINENSVDLNEKSISASFIKVQQQQQQQQQNKQSTILSRRPSYASINDTTEQAFFNSNSRMPTYSGKTQNLSGGSSALTSNNPIQVGISSINASNLNASTSQQTKSNPEYIRLSVYGLQEPDNEMKQDLCKTLQSELDYWLLNRMCNSIEKNTYKTTSAQHPDKLTDEDLAFFKQICDNYFDFEIPLPFVFNFNKTLRENFFFFVKQVFNSNFKAIDAPLLLFPNILTNKKQTTTTSTTSEQKLDFDSEFDKGSDNFKRAFKTSSTTSTTTQPVSCQFLTQQLSFSFMSMQPALGPADTLTDKSKKQTISNINDPFLLLSRIFFQNSKAKRIGKHNVSLILVEALYAIKGLDYLVSSKVTRSNSIGSNSLVQPSKQMTQNQILETSYTKCRETGPTFVFRFYCRGENTEINIYKAQLKSALNDALLYFLSEYFTKIDPDIYLKKIQLQKKPASFRVFELNEQESVKLARKRHKSTGTTELLSQIQSIDKEFLRMNKTARETKLGRLLLSQKIIDESQLYEFIDRNFYQNLFDHRDYQDTIEYFRETIKQFDSNKILNCFVLNTNRKLTKKTHLFSLNCNENSTDSDIDSDLSNNSTALSPNSSASSLNTSLQKPLRSISMDPNLDRLEKTFLAESLGKKIVDYEKSLLRIIYDWLKGLYFIQYKSNINSSTRSSSSISSFNSIGNLQQKLQTNTSQPILSQQQQLQQQQNQQQQQQQQQQAQSPINNSTSTNSSNQPTSYILRKQFNYRTKYNLTNLIRDLELNLRDLCKCELSVNYYSFKKQANELNRHLSHNDSVFIEDQDKLNNESATDKNFANPLIDDVDFGYDFTNLKQTKFSNIHNCLSKSENLIITLNAEYTGISSQMNTINSGVSSLSLSMSSSINSSSSQNTTTGSISYARVPSFGSNNNNNNTNNIQSTSQTNQSSSVSSSTATLVISTGSSSSGASSSSQISNQTVINQTNTNQSNNIMMKSISSTSGDLDSSMSLSSSLALTALQLKRTYCYALVNSKFKTVIFYCFTTESANYDSIKQWIEQMSDLITQRYNLVNNTVLYKFGGLIGDHLITDLKKVKQLTLNSVQNNFNHNYVESSQSESSIAHEFKVKTQINQLTSIKLSKSPTMHRQLSYNKSFNSQINPALIANLQFNTAGSVSQTSLTGSTSSPLITQQNQIFSIKQLYMNNFNLKSYDSIINIINQQVNFCSQYLTTSQSQTQSNDHNSIISPNNLKANSSNQSITNTPNMSLNRASLNPVFLNQLINTSSSSSFFGVGLSYQLYEMQQIYRHPRKIYELAINLSNQANTSPNSSSQQNLPTAKPNPPGQIKQAGSSSLISPNNQQIQNKFNLNDFYKNCIQPVLIPFHYCCTPLLFFSNWNDSIISEKMLKQGYNQKIFNNKNEISNKPPTGNESWYSEMRKIVLIEYTKYFESHGFTRLKDDRVPFQQQNSNISTNRGLSHQQLHQQNNNNSQSETGQILHFIKWIQQDGFLYLTMNLEEIYLHVKVGYCSRYRSWSRIGFINEIIRFLTNDFHVHSFIYDFHLSAINTNFLSTSQAGMQISQTSYIISKFLDEFVEFFSRVPLYSQNKVFKLIYEKTDSSLKSHQSNLIFDFIIYAKKKITSDKSLISSFKTLYIFDNNIAIYSITDSQKMSNNQSDCSKYLIVKIENYSKEVSSYSPIDLKRLNKNLALNQLSKQTSISKYSNTSSSTSSLVNNNNYNNNSEKMTQTKQESYIRITCFYLFIRKNQQTSGSLANTSLMNGLNNDLEFINKVIEESINMYKQEIFWDNLTLSMYSIKNILDENKSSSQVFSIAVTSQELEQILFISQKINIIDLDPELGSFLKHCYMIRDKIKNYLKFSFGRHFIYAESDSVEYCIMLINEDLIRNFRLDEESIKNNTQQNKTNSLNESDQQLKSFILLKFDKENNQAQLMQVNRVKMSKQESLINQNQLLNLNKRSNTADSSILMNTSDQQLASSFKNDINLNTTTIQLNSSVFMNKYLSFTVNILMYVLWENLFFSN